MKNIILASFGLFSIVAFGQKQLTSITEIFLNQSGQFDEIDSTAYIYSNSLIGTLPEFKPKFEFAEDFFGFILPTDKPAYIIHSNQERFFSGGSYPLQAQDTTFNTLSANNKVIESIQDQFSRTLYEYNASGKMTLRLSQNNFGMNWETFDSSVFKYDNFDQLITSENYFVSPGFIVGQLDSIFYNSGTSSVNKSKSYFVDLFNGTTDLNSQTEVSYNGNNVQYVDLYEDDGNGGLEGLYRLVYNYSGTEPSGFIAYEVVNNAPTTTIFATGIFNSNSQNLHSEYTLIFGNDTVKQTYEYDLDNFITKRTYYSPDSTGTLIPYYITNYSYSYTTGIDKKEQIDLIIYPNPAEDFIYLESSVKIMNIQIYNLTGQLVLEQNYGSISIAHLQAGTYIIQGQTKDGSFTSKFVRQ
ncbi:MAG: T9SS type A sorting domain-containing protein [Crocinitomicaceae bacterium]